MDSTLTLQLSSPSGKHSIYDRIMGSFHGSLIKHHHWFRGDAHPLITGFPSSISKYFKTLADAEGYMKAQGVKQYSLVIKEGAGETTPEKNQAAYYAVAHGRTPGIRRYY